MDKIDESIFDKLSITGFFNIIISGAVLLYGFSPILGLYVPGIFYSQLGLQKDLEKAIIICLVCYIFGSALQCLQVLFFKGLKAAVVNKSLSAPEGEEDGKKDNGILANKYKRKGAIELAQKLFKEKDLGEFDPEDTEMSRYFFDYCEYSNMIKGYSTRADRLSESAAFYEQLAVAFFTLTLAGLVVMLILDTNVWGFCFWYLLMGAIFTGRAYHCRLNWAKAVFATYEAAADLEAEEKPEEEAEVCPEAS